MTNEEQAKAIWKLMDDAEAAGLSVCETEEGLAERVRDWAQTHFYTRKDPRESVELLNRGLYLLQGGELITGH